MYNTVKAAQDYHKQDEVDPKAFKCSNCNVHGCFMWGAPAQSSVAPITMCKAQREQKRKAEALELAAYTRPIY